MNLLNKCHDDLIQTFFILLLLLLMEIRVGFLHVIDPIAFVLERGLTEETLIRLSARGDIHVVF